MTRGRPARATSGAGRVLLAAVLLAAVLLAACGSPAASTPVASSAAGTSTPAASGTATASPESSSPPEAGWQVLADPVDGPVAREDHTWTLTPDAATAFLFGGRTADGSALGDLWAYDLATDAWQAVTADGPAPRFGHNAAWVEGVGLVVFAGQAGTTFFDDLWAFDPAADAWRRLPSEGDAPVPRYGSCAALGPDGRLWISHGFTADGRRFADTRAYDFASGTWTDETPPGAVPAARCLHGCWWTDAGQLALYAGQTTGVTALGDLWTLTIGPRQGTHAWNQVSGVGLPAERNLYAVATWNEFALVFGGQALDGGYLDDLWVIGDEDSTREYGDLTERPPPRAGAELVVDPLGGRILLFGGRNADGVLADLWELPLGGD